MIISKKDIFELKTKRINYGGMMVRRYTRTQEAEKDFLPSCVVLLSRWFILSDKSMINQRVGIPLYNFRE